MLSEAFWTPNINLSQFDENSQLGSRSKVSGLRHIFSIFSGPMTGLLSMLCFLMKIVSHANARKKTKMLKARMFVREPSWKYLANLAGS